jgi:hypothetical protein
MNSPSMFPIGNCITRIEGTGLSAKTEQLHFSANTGRDADRAAAYTQYHGQQILRHRCLIRLESVIVHQYPACQPPRKFVHVVTRCGLGSLYQ